MASLLRTLSTVFAVGLIGGAGVLMMLPRAIEGDEPLGSEAAVTSPAPHCQQQTGSNVEPQCSAAAQPAEIAKHDAEPDVADIQPAASPDEGDAGSPATQVKPAPDGDAGRGQRKGTTPASARAPTPPAPSRLTIIAEEAYVPSRPRAARRNPSQGPRTTQPQGSMATIPVLATGSDGTLRTIIIRPTSAQDAYYYQARRTIAGSGSSEAR